MCVCVCVLFSSFNIMFQGSSTLYGKSVLHSFLWLNNIHCVDIPHLFIHSAIGGHLGCFHSWAVVNSAALNTACRQKQSVF
jgi:hypothetical protein